MKTGNKILGAVFLAMILFTFSVVLIRPGIKLFGRLTSEQAAAFDTLSAYPFQDDVSKQNEDKDEDMVSIYAPIKRINDKISSMEEHIKIYTTSHFYLQHQCVLATKIADKVMGLDMTTSLTAGQNDMGDDGDLVLPYYGDSFGFVIDDVDISPELGNLTAFGHQMNNEGRNFLFFMVPGKYTENVAYRDYSLERHDRIIGCLETAGLDTFDMEDIIKKMGMDLSSLFFRTDHHWLPSTGIWADKLLCEYMNENYNYNIDTTIFDPENYETTILENHFLGSMGRKLTSIYTSAEDFPIILPKYSTDLEVFNSKPNKTMKGNIQDTLFDYSIMEIDSPYSRNDYAFYGYGDQSVVTIKNANVHDGRRILLIKTSFADCMYPYLASVVENLDVIDLRQFKGSLQTFINETNPDTVIMIYGITAVNKSGDILFDFR